MASGHAPSLLTLPTDALARVFSFVPLPRLCPCLAAVRTTCHQAHAALLEDDLWQALRPLVEAPPDGRSSARKSQRLALHGVTDFKRAWRNVNMRGEALHHALAVMGQDTKGLTLGALKKILAAWGPARLVDRASPVYNATLLMEVCKARGTRESNLVSCAEHLLTQLGADVNARPPGDASCTPLIIASCRGLPRLAALFLRHGARPDVRGEGRFRLATSHRTLFGCHTAHGWVTALLRAEEQLGVADEAREPLARCRALLERAMSAALQDAERSEV